MRAARPRPATARCGNILLLYICYTSARDRHQLYHHSDDNSKQEVCAQQHSPFPIPLHLSATCTTTPSPAAVPPHQPPHALPTPASCSIIGISDDEQTSFLLAAHGTGAHHLENAVVMQHGPGSNWSAAELLRRRTSFSLSVTDLQAQASSLPQDLQQLSLITPLRWVPCSTLQQRAASWGAAGTCGPGMKLAGCSMPLLGPAGCSMHA